MRILLTVEFYHPRIGGAEMAIQRIAEGLVRRGHQVSVATSWDPARTDRVHHGVDVVQFKVRGNLARGMIGDVTRYREWLQGERFDVVMNYAAQAWPTDAALAVLPGLSGVRALATGGFSGLHGLRRLLYLGYFRMLRERIGEYDALIYHSQAGADAAFGRRYGRGAHVVIPNGADGAEFTGPPQRFRTQYGVRTRHLLLHVGNHYRVKGHHHLFRVLRALSGLDVTLVLVGDDPRGGRSCWATCDRLAVRDPRVILLRRVPRADLVSAYLDADVVLLTSGFEAAPLVLVEAMAAGVPFVSFGVGNARELPGGLVVRGAGAMAKAIGALLRDDDRRRALGEAGRTYQRQALEWEAIVGQYEHLYHRLLTQQGSRAP